MFHCTVCQDRFSMCSEWSNWLGLGKNAEPVLDCLKQHGFRMSILKFVGWLDPGTQLLYTPVCDSCLIHMTHMPKQSREAALVKVGADTDFSAVAITRDLIAMQAEQMLHGIFHIKNNQRVSSARANSLSSISCGTSSGASYIKLPVYAPPVQSQFKEPHRQLSNILEDQAAVVNLS